MTILDRLRAHKGGLVRIKTQLYWYDGRGFDRVWGRICLLLDAATDNDLPADTEAAAGTPRCFEGGLNAVALLLIDGQPHWVWVAAEDIELLDGDHR